MTRTIQLPYASELIEIFEGGLNANAKKVRAYGELMIQKMRHDDFGDELFIKMIEDRLSGEYKKQPKLVMRESVRK